MARSRRAPSATRGRGCRGPRRSGRRPSCAGRATRPSPGRRSACACASASCASARARRGRRRRTRSRRRWARGAGGCVRPRVDLPQPDSPTRPTVSPRRTSRSTPSTAWSWPVVRRRKPCLTGKYFLRPRTRSRMSSSAAPCRRVGPASRCPRVAHEAIPIGLAARGPFSHSQHADSCSPTGEQGRQLLGQRSNDVVAARREPAPGRPVERARHHAADRLQRRRVAHPEQRDRAQQRLGVGVLRASRRSPSPALARRSCRRT